MFQRHSKRPFTIIETLLCIGLISLASSLFAIKGRELWQRHQFFASVDRLCEELILTRHFVQSLRADVDLFLIKEADGVRMIRYFDEPGMKKMKNAFAAELVFKHIAITEDQNLFFYGNGWHDLGEKINITGVENITISLSFDNFTAKKFVK